MRNQTCTIIIVVQYSIIVYRNIEYSHIDTNLLNDEPAQKLTWLTFVFLSHDDVRVFTTITDQL